MTHLFKIFILLFTYNIAAQNTEIGFGVIGKLELNRFISINNPNNDANYTAQNKSKLQTAGGLYAYIAPRNRIMFDASLLLTRAKYKLNYVQGTATMLNADIRLAETNFNISYFLSKRTANIRPFVLVGVQALWRRWGEENYVNAIIQHSYWPNTVLMSQVGIGCKINLNNSASFIQPFTGLRRATHTNTIYDTPINQIFVGVVIGFKKMKSNNRSKINKCFTF